MNAYIEMTGRHQQEFNEFPMFFAFTDKQFEENMAQLGLTPNDTDKIYSLKGTGGFYLRSDGSKLHEMSNRQAKERKDAIDADKKGTGFIYDMFRYELVKHDFGFTWDLTETLDILGLSMEDVEKSKALSCGLKKAIAKFEKNDGWWPYR